MKATNLQLAEELFSRINSLKSSLRERRDQLCRDNGVNPMSMREIGKMNTNKEYNEINKSLKKLRFAESEIRRNLSVVDNIASVLK